MPELPEVETVVRELRERVVGRSIRKCEIPDPKLRNRKLRAVIGKRITRVLRMGKQIVFVVASKEQEPSIVAIHLRMSGRLIWAAKGERRPDYIRAVMYLGHGKLYFVDPRRFGTITVLPSLADARPVGIEPLSEDFTVNTLAALLRTCRQELKQFFIRQDKIVGVGNIYASEILFRAGVSPKRKTYALSKSEIIKLHRAIRHVLQEAIRYCGTTFSDFQTTSGESGGFQDFLRVYDREGKSCKRCKTSIRRITQQGRSTYFCSCCQK